jgi:hypothetical protein
MRLASILVVTVGLLGPSRGPAGAPDLGLESDRGPDTIDVSTYPEQFQKTYPLFANKCSKCHSLARPINARIEDPSFWNTYVEKMARRAGSGINPTNGKQIAAFLGYYTEQKKAGVPVNLQLAVLFKVLVYDRALPSRTKDGLRFAVVFNPADEASRAMKDAVAGAFRSSPRNVAGVAVELVEVPEADLPSQEGLDIVYACRGTDVSRLTGDAHPRSVVTFSSDESAIRSGVALGVVARGTKPRLLINVPASIACGMSLDPQALGAAELVR